MRRRGKTGARAAIKSIGQQKERDDLAEVMERQTRKQTYMEDDEARCARPRARARLILTSLAMHAAAPPATAAAGASFGFAATATTTALHSRSRVWRRSAANARKRGRERACNGAMAERIEEGLELIRKDCGVAKLSQ